MKNVILTTAALLIGGAATTGMAQAQPMEMFAPVPQAAMGPMVDQQIGYLVEEIGDGLYWLTEGVYQTMFLTTGEGVIIVDAPPSIGENILKAVASVTDEPITHVIYSHTHSDHIGAAGLYPAGLTIIAHEATAAHLAAKNDANRPVPTQTFADNLTLSVGRSSQARNHDRPSPSKDFFNTLSHNPTFEPPSAAIEFHP